MLTERSVRVSLHRALQPSSWSGLTRVLLITALAGCCATVLYARVYQQFDRVRVKVVTTERRPSGGSVVVPLPDLSGLAGFPPVVVLRLENRDRVATTVSVSINAAELARVALPPERTVRVDLSMSVGAGSALSSARIGSDRLRVRGEADGWSLHYLEVANVHGFSHGFFSFVIVPSGSDRYDSASAIASLSVFGILWMLSLALLEFGQNQAMRRAQTALGLLVLIFFVTTLAIATVSKYKVLLSVETFWLCVAILYSPVLVQAYTQSRSTLRWLYRVALVAVVGMVGRRLRDGMTRWYRAARVMTARDLGSRLHTLGYPALLLASVPFLIGTHTIYASNLDEFALPFRYMAAPWLLAVVGVTWVLLTVPGCLLSNRLVRVYAATLFGLSLLLWAQGNLWVGDYGVLDGSEIDFERLAWRVPYELGIWLAVLAAAVAFGQRVSRIAPLASQMFLGVQIVAILAGQNAERQVRWAEAPPEIYQFSSQQNVIFVVLDEFQSDVFDELVELDRPWFDERFSGFVYFVDHAGAFPTTALSMPAILTGRIYRNARSVPEFWREAFGDASIFRGLQEHGYEIDVASILGLSWLNAWFAAGGEEGGFDVTRFRIRKPYVGMEDYRRFTARQLIELSAFRHVPHVAKQALAKHPDWFTRVFWTESLGSVADERRYGARNSQVFFSQFIDKVTVDRNRPLFKLIHLGIPHRPVVVDENCRFVGEIPFSREAYLGQSRCAVDLVAVFLDRLRALGVYDQSLIVVLSDHGIGIEPRGFAGESGSLPRQAGETTPGLTSMAGRAKALMLVKPPGRDGPLVISRAPTVHTDVPVTIFDILDLSHAFEGISMLKRDPAQPRSRTYGTHGLRGQRFPKGYLARLDVITIERDLLDASGWTHERSILPPDLELPAQTIDLGTDDAGPYLGPGWSRSKTEEIDGREITFAWGLGRRAAVFASLPSGTAQLTVRLSAAENRNKVVELEIDGRRLGRITVRGERYQDVTLQIPPDPDRPRISWIVFHFRPIAQADAAGVKVDRISFQSS